ncbi:MAG: PTS sugar transporter subunit IIC, partial [Endomicrobiia bacterium]|nr:PTS sugar transporter subunit IIC [Endomicrobiia bacterium]
MNDIFFALVSALLAMDAVVFGQFGFSRPIVCGPVAGFLVGDPLMGLRVGVILELIWINTIPIGTTLAPDVAVASLLTVFWSAAAKYCGAPEGVVVVTAMAAALPVSMIFRKLSEPKEENINQLQLYLHFFNIKKG